MAVNLKQIAAPSSHESWDPEVGESVKGRITFAKIMGAKPNFNGDKMEQELRVDIVDDDGEQTTIWAVVNTDVEGDGYPSRLARAIAAAVDAAGSDELEEGGTLALVRVDDVPPSKKGHKPAKEYEGAYKKPSVQVKLALASQGDDDGDDEEPPPPTPIRKTTPSAADLLG